MQKKRIPGAPPGSQGPKFEDFDFAYESEQIQKMAMQSDKANLADIDKQLAAADKEIARLAGRTSQLGRSGAQQIKAQNYENKVIETRRFLESERETVVNFSEVSKRCSAPMFDVRTIVALPFEGPIIADMNGCMPPIVNV